MNNVTNTQEKLKTAEDQKKKKKLPTSNIKKEYDILKHKYLLQENIKKLSPKDKQDLEAEYKDIFGPQFGQLTMTSEEKSKYFELKDEYERLEGRRGIKEIAKIHADLMRAPLPEKFDGFKKQDPNRDSDEPVPSEEQVRIILAALPSELLSVFNQYFTVRFYKTTDKDQLNSLIQEATGGAIVDKYKDASNNNKFRISVDLDSFYTDYQKEIEGIKYTQSKFNINKFLYTITRAILSTVKDKSEFTEFAKKHAKLKGKKLDKNCETEYDDWLAYYLTNPEKAKNADPELYEAAKKWLQQSYAKPNFVDYDGSSNRTVIRSSNIDPKLEKGKKVWKNAQTDEAIRSQGWLNFLNIMDSVGLSSLGNRVFGISEYFNEIKLAYQEGYLFSQNEDTDKEVKRLMGRELSGGDYHKLLRKPLYYNDEDKMKALIFVLAEKGAYHWQFGQLWLWRWDRTFQKTKGREVSMKGFNFINKVSGIVGSKTKVVKTIEYKQVGTHFVHNTYQDQITRLDSIFDTFSLRDIQRAAPDVFANLYCADTRKFLNIDAKLGENPMGEKDPYYIQNDVSLSEILPKGQDKEFTEAMQAYAADNKEADFNRLVDPVVISLVKKYLQESRREPMLFNMYTSPMVRKGFEYYKNFVEETSESQTQYDEEYKELKNKLEEHNLDPEEAIEDESYEDIEIIYKDYAKTEREQPYTRGREKTKFGKIKELMRQSQIKVEKALREIPIPDELKSFIDSQLIKFNDKSDISIEEVNRFQSDLDKKLLEISPDLAIKVRKIIDEHLKDLERFTVIRGYQSVFRPYMATIERSKAKKGLDNKKAESLKKWYFMELLPEKSSIQQKLTDIENHSDNNITFTEAERRDISSLGEDQAPKLTNLLMQKLSTAQKSNGAGFFSNYEELNNLYFNANQALLYPDQFRDDIPAMISKFQDLTLIPQSVKDDNINNLEQMLGKLRIAKVVADDYYNQQETRKQYRNGRNVLGYDPMREYEDEYEEELAETA